MPSEHAVNELKFNLEHADVIKARLVLANLNEYSPEVRKRLLYELSKSEDILCMRILSSLFKNREDLFQLYSGLENLFYLKAKDNPRFLLEQLKPNTANLRAYVWIVGKLEMQEAANSLENLLYKVKEAYTIVHIVRALGEIKTINNPRVLAEFLFLEDKDIFREAVNSLGKIGTPACLDYLLEALGRQEELDFLVLDILGQKGDDPALERLNSLLQSPSPFIRNQAADKLAENGSRAVSFLVNNLQTRDADTQIQSLNILARIGDRQAVRPIMKLISSYPRDPNLRFAAYEALGNLPVEKSAYVLAQGFLDSEESVRLSVAKAIDHNCNRQLVAGIANMLNDSEMASKIVQAIVNAQTEQLFLDLLDNKVFWDQARQYLLHRAHPDIREYYSGLLQNRKRQDLARILVPDDTAADRGELKICAVDDFRMVLQAFRSNLYELGYEVVVFSSPEEALAWLENQKPDLVFTDLNMPEIDGIEFIRLLRRRYLANDLPLVMVTSQKDAESSRKAYQMGANAVLIKPFSREDLQKVVDNLVLNK